MPFGARLRKTVHAMKKFSARSHRANSNLSDLLRVYNLKVYFSKGFFRKHTIRAVDDVSFRIKRGETFGLVGESGCGKSTLARCLLRLVEPTGGEIFFNGIELCSYGNIKDLRRKIQIIFQDSDGALNPRLTASDLILEPLKIHGLIKGKIFYKAGELFRMVNLPSDVADRHSYELSGGQRQRINIARAFSLMPELVVADEAAASLDVLMQSQIVELLKKLQSEFGMSYLFISHNLNLVRRIADRMAVMYLGKFVETGFARDVFKKPEHPYTRALISSLPAELPSIDGNPISLKGETPSPLRTSLGCVFVNRCPEAQEICSVRVPSLRQINSSHKVACHFI
jgi:oligopeptide transport system ATP-binding protein